MLNGMFTHQKQPPPGAVVASTSFVSATQRSALEHVRQSVKLAGAPPLELSPAEALKQLRVASWYGLEGTTLGSFQLERVSLPAPGGTAVPLAALWGDNGHVVVDDFLR